MPLVRVRILQAATVVGSPTKPFAGDTTVKAVLEKVLEGHVAFIVRSLDTFPDAGHKADSRSQIEPADFSTITVGELALSGIGLFWVARVEHDVDFHTPAGRMPAPGRAGAEADSTGADSTGDGSDSARSSLPNSLDSMMRREASVEVTWPPDSTGANYDARIFNALVTDVKAQGLGWHYADVAPGGSGTKLLKALAKALQYALPFDVKGALARRSMHIPDRFTVDSLKVHSN